MAIPVVNTEGEFVGLMMCFVPGLKEKRAVAFMSKPAKDWNLPPHDNTEIVHFQVEYWTGRDGVNFPVLIAPAGWTLGQLRTVEYFR